MSFFVDLLGSITEAIFDTLIGPGGKKSKKGQKKARSGANTAKGSSRTQTSPQTSSAANDSIHEVNAKHALVTSEYSPRRDGNPDPGEVVWTWVPYEEDANRGKDRPVLIIGRSGDGFHVAQLTSKDHDIDASQEARWGRYWFDIGTGEWDPKRRPSEVRLDRILWVPAQEIRRVGAILPQSTFIAVIDAMRACPTNQ